MHESPLTTDMSAQNTLDALSRALDLFCYERGLGLSTMEELLADRHLSPSDRHWLENFAALWQLTRALEDRASGLVARGLSRVECELIDYQHAPPYRVYVGEGSTQPDEFKGYYAANLYARAQSAGKTIPVYIRDGTSVLFWAIRLTGTTCMDGPICISHPT